MGEITGLEVSEPLHSEPLPVAGLFCVINYNFNVLLLFLWLTVHQLFASTENLRRIY